MRSMSETVKLLQSSFSASNDFGATRTLKKSGIFRMLQSASKQLPAAFYSWILLLVLFVILMISGSIMYSTAENNEINQIVKYNNQITAYESNGYPLLLESSFRFLFNSTDISLVYPNYTETPVPLTESEYPLPSFSEDQVTASYDRLQYAMTASFFPSIPFPQPPFNEEIPSVTCKLFATMNVTDSVFVTADIPLYQSSTIVMSTKATPSECTDEGGYYFDQDHSCTFFAALSEICITVQKDQAGQWELENNNGCYYPFGGLGVYNQVDCSTGSSFNFPSVSLEVRSNDDPAVFLEDITDGHNSFDYSTDEKKQKGIDIMATACIPLVLAISVCLIMYQTQSRWKLADIATVNLLKSGAAFRVVEKKNSVVTVFGILAAISFGVLAVGVSLLGHWSLQPVVNIQGFIPIQLVVFFLPISFITLTLFLSSLCSSSWTYRMKSITLVATSVWCIFVCLFSIFYLIRPGEESGPLKGNSDSISIFFGTAACFVFGPYAVVCIFLAGTQKKPRKAKLAHDERDSYGTDLEPLLEAASERISDRRFKNNMTAYYLICLFVVIPTIFVLVCVLPPIWNVYWEVYRVLDSPYSLVAPQNGENHTNFKLYEDVVVFYSYFYALVMCGFLLTFKPLRKLFHKTIVFGRFATTTVGEVFFIVSWLMVFTKWVYFWAFEYDRIADLEGWERSSRALGHVCNFMMSCLIFPVSRNSIWDFLFGVPFERAIKYHRWLGYMTVSAFTLHMLSWFGYYLNNNYSIAHNLWTLQNEPHADNWTISMMIWGAWFPSVLMAITAYDYFRRKYFELFFYVHHLYILIFIYALIHAWSLWYFLAPGITLYFVDRLIRFVRGSHEVDVVSVAYGFGGNVRIEFRPPRGFTWKAGQYVFLNIPAISIFQWHPFSISVSPYSENIVLCLKDMGKETFTNKVARVALSPWAGTSSIKVDGPYGNSFNYSEAQVIVLVAGGIGVTPMHSVLTDIYQTCLSQPEKTSHIRKVYFFWSVREFPILELFKDSLVRIQNFNLNDRFQVSLTSTLKPEFDSTHSVNGVDNEQHTLNSSFDDSNLVVKHGRFDCQKLFTEMVAEFHDVPRDQILCHACGPTQMVDDVSQLANKFGFEMQTETFEL